MTDQPAPPAPQPYAMFNLAEVAEALKVTSQTMRDQIRHGNIPALKIGKRFRITEPDLRRYLGLTDDRGLPGDLETIKRIQLSL